MYFDRFDIVEAYYMYFNNYHSGMWSEEYSRLSKILTYFKPSPILRTENDLSDNGREIYDKLVQNSVGAYGC